MLWNIQRYIFWTLSIFVALLSWRFIFVGMDAAFTNLPLQLELNPLLFQIHVFTGPIALVLAPVQLSRRVRTKKPKLHCWLGRLYVLTVLLASITGFFVAFNAEGGIFAKAGFIVLSLLWLWTTAKGILCARAKQFTQHRAWMLQSAALTFAGAMLRVWLPLQIIAGVPFDIAYPIVAWACWIPNLLFARLYLNRSVNTGTALTSDIEHI